VQHLAHLMRVQALRLSSYGAGWSVRTELEALNLVPFVKTSGGKGVHITVPVKPEQTWGEVHKRCSAIACAPIGSR
jgi:DNA primase